MEENNIKISRGNDLKEDDKAFGVVPENQKDSTETEKSSNANSETQEKNETFEARASENVDARNFEFGATGSAQTKDDFARKSPIKRFFSNLEYVLSYTPALIYTGLSTLFFLLGMLFFLSRRNTSLGVAEIVENHPEVITSYSILMYAFVAFLIIAGTLFVSSIILNVIRSKEGRK